MCGHIGLVENFEGSKIAIFYSLMRVSRHTSPNKVVFRGGLTPNSTFSTESQANGYFSNLATGGAGAAGTAGTAGASGASGARRLLPRKAP